MIVLSSNFGFVDLQFSSEEDEELEEVTGYEAGPDDDSQQVAEAMVQLGNIAYYTEQAPGRSINTNTLYFNMLYNV